uniref:Coatomer subunit alpha n=1 Tax=Hirondellea gigas TaxID=1518452 RepID=A0A6A7FQ53_9CRUS
MLIKFETKSNRVKGLAFHHKRPWILASLHNGVIQLYDYRMEVLVEKFEEHDGPVRGVDFHFSQPLFVSGGDDYKIKVWNYNLHRCLFQLVGHTDYIRSVKFHHEAPWILSASDDQTLRIWNWQNRTCLSVLTGHNHYVMCGEFHPTEDLVLSASLDESVRVWDISGLRKRSSQNLFHQDFRPGAQELFGGSHDVTVKHILEGHSRGVNWACFHKTMPLIVSGADDREVKLWRMSESKAFIVDTMRGHTNNVSCVIFHPKRELIVSNSEDKSVRVWDISKQNRTQTFRRVNDRYWILAAHPKLNLLAAGHDNGFIVFKLERERPAYDVFNHLFYYKDRYVRRYDFQSGKDVPLMTTRRVGNFAQNSGSNPRTLLYNSANTNQHNIIVITTADQGTYDLYVFAKSRDRDVDQRTTESPSPLRGVGKSVAFVSRNRFAVLDRDHLQISLKNLSNETKKKLRLPVTTVNHIFPAGMQRLLLRCPDRLILYDTATAHQINELVTPGRFPVKYVVWSEKHEFCAILSKYTLFIADNNLQQLCLISETSRVKSGSWDPAGAFIYTTQNHIKYCLPSGESGIVRTLNVPVYVTMVRGSTMYALDREWNPVVIEIENTEYAFKIALGSRNYPEVARIIKSNKLVGESIISYLLKNDFAEGALHFKQDPKTKFSLAIECGNIESALECAEELNSTDCWQKLGTEALRQGLQKVVENALVKTGNLEHLSFLYFITGNLPNMRKMLTISECKDDPMSQFHNALFLGDVETRIKVLKSTGYPQLAYLTAKTHNLVDQMNELKQDLGDREMQIPDVSKATLLQPPIPILQNEGWPKLEVPKGVLTAQYFHDLEVEQNIDAKQQEIDRDTLGFNVDEPTEDVEEDDESWKWGDDMDITSPKGDKDPDEEAGNSDIGDWSDGGEYSAKDSDGPLDDFFMPNAGPPSRQQWMQNSPPVADIVASGSFDIAMVALNRQFGIVNFDPLKPYFLKVRSCAQIQLQLLPNTTAIESALLRSSSPSLPLIGFTFQHCFEILDACYKDVTAGKNEKAIAAFKDVLYTLPLLSTDSSEQLKEILDMLKICREYVTALRLLKQRKQESDPVKQMELACYFTLCSLQPIHIYIGLLHAVKLGRKIENYRTTAVLCRRLLELAISIELPANLQKPIRQVKELLKVCEKKNTDAHELTVSLRAGSEVLCCSSFQSIAQNKRISCPYCDSNFDADCHGRLCLTCNLSIIGNQAPGFSQKAGGGRSGGSGRW